MGVFMILGKACLYESKAVFWVSSGWDKKIEEIEGRKY